MSGRSITKEVFRLHKNIRSISRGQAVVLSGDADDDCKRIAIEITPDGGPYRGGKFTFEITITEDYPDEHPIVECKTPIYHPNIDPTCNNGEENICLNLFSEWESSFGLDDCVQGFLFLLHSPNLEDPLSPLFESSYGDVAPIREYLDTVQRTLQSGCTIDGVTFARNWHLSEVETERYAETYIAENLRELDKRQLSKIERLLSRNDSLCDVTTSTANIRAHVTHVTDCRVYYVDSDPTVNLLMNVFYTILCRAMAWYKR